MAFSKYEPAPMVAPTTAPVIIPAMISPNIGARAAKKNSPLGSLYISGLLNTYPYLL